MCILGHDFTRRDAYPDRPSQIFRSHRLSLNPDLFDPGAIQAKPGIVDRQRFNGIDLHLLRGLPIR